MTTYLSGPGKIDGMQIPVFHLNVFPYRPGSGNPAGVCILDHWLDDESLRRVAAENNLSATAFMMPNEAKGYAIRWFSVRCELQLCGHATFASGYVMLKLLRPDLDQVSFETRLKGTVTVRKDGDLLAMDFPALAPQPCRHPPALLTEGLGAAPEAVLEANSVYFAVFADQGALENIRPNSALLERLHPYAVCATAPGNATDYVLRYFAPGYGLPEDPVTGSAHCALVPYWSGQLAKSRLHVRQLSLRGGELWTEMAGDRVLLKGKAELTFRGELEIR